MLSCDVISDLMPAYRSREASEETRRLVEEHLRECSICRMAFGDESKVKESLQGLNVEWKQGNGGRFLITTRRWAFAIGSCVLLFFNLFLAAFGSIMVGSVGITLPEIPNPLFVWLSCMAVLGIVYALLILWRDKIKNRVRTHDLLISFFTGVPLLIMALILLHVISIRDTWSILFAVTLFLTALIITFILLARLPYMTIVTLTVLLLINGILLGSIVFGVVGLGDFSIEKPVELGHPKEGMALEDAVRIDMTPLEFEWIQSEEVPYVDNIAVGRHAKAVRATYAESKDRVFLTVIQFDEFTKAESFIDAWDNTVGEIQAFGLELHLPGLLGEGRILRFYDVRRRRAYSAWHTEKWVIVIEVPGAMSKAGRIAHDVKELVVSHYRELDTAR